MVLVEVCVEDPHSAQMAIHAGARRLELCSCLTTGGVTPSAAMMRRIISDSVCPVAVLIRCRPGCFVYSPVELEIMAEDVRISMEVGAEAAVIGALDSARELCASQVEALTAAAATSGVTSGKRKFAWHRAIDACVKPIDGLTTLASFGCLRVLSSGCTTCAASSTAIEQFATWSEAVPTIQLLPGGGITAENVGCLLGAGFTEVHGSCKASSGLTALPLDPLLEPRPPADTQSALGCCNMGACPHLGGFHFGDRTIVDPLRVAALLNAAEKYRSG